jgi:hypothetical protein
MTWKPLADAKKLDDAGNPIPVLLYLPGAWHKTDETGVPLAAAHGCVVGWWDAKVNGWVTGTWVVAPNLGGQQVYPSLWTELPAWPGVDPATERK